MVEIPQSKDNQVSLNVGFSDTKNEEADVRKESEVQRAQYPNYFEVTDFKLPETGKNMSNSELWHMLNMDALQLMACHAYLVSTGQIDPKTGKIIKNEKGLV